MKTLFQLFLVILVFTLTGKANANNASGTHTCKDDDLITHIVSGSFQLSSELNDDRLVVQSDYGNFGIYQRVSKGKLQSNEKEDGNDVYTSYYWSRSLTVHILCTQKDEFNSVGMVNLTSAGMKRGLVRLTAESKNGCMVHILFVHASLDPRSNKSITVGSLGYNLGNLVTDWSLVCKD